jgi:diguanylate cyclase (GGDEF)-like protein
VPVVVRASPLHDTAGKITGAIEVFTANTKRNDLLAEMEKIRKEALTDELTGIGNRKYGEVTLKQLAEGTNQGKAYGILFVDIDHFKHVNDTWGHHVGDRVLRMVAQTLAHGLREYDALCRWGGEEFVLILPNVTAETLAIAGERFRMLVERSWVDFEAEQIFVTVSLGGAISRIGEAPVAAVERADANLYCSKKGGRNCVSVEVAC